ncbi:SGNH/GDSL hydrolase family protein [Segnochrobactraceae bacterium EtOH-i3]
MADITDAFAAAFPDGYAVAKPEARAIGPIMETALGLLSAALAGGNVAVFATKAALLASATEALGAYVHADGAAVPERPVQGNNGLWVRENSSATWSYASTFVLPGTVLGTLLDLQNAIAALGDLATRDSVGTSDIVPRAVTRDRMAEVPSGTLLGRVAAGDGVLQELSAAAVRTLIDVAPGATANARDEDLRDRTSHTGTQPIATVAGLQDALDAGAGELAALAGTLGDLATRDSVGTSDIVPRAVTRDRMAEVPSGTLLGRVAAGDGVLQELSAAAVRTLIDVAPGATANARDEDLRDRASHTGTQPIATVAGLQDALDAGAGGLSAETVRARREEAALAGQATGRPGDGLAGTAVAGTVQSALGARIPADWTVTDPVLGAAVEITGAGVPPGAGYLDLAPVERIALEAGHVYRATWVLRQTADVTDPAGDTVRRWIQWTDGAKAATAAQVVLDDTPTVASGVSTVTRLIAGVAGDGVDIVWPAGARYGVPVLRRYGTTGSLRVAVCRIEDVTEAHRAWLAAGAVGANLSAVTARVGAAESDLDALGLALATWGAAVPAIGRTGEPVPLIKAGDDVMVWLDGAGNVRARGLAMEAAVPAIGRTGDPVPLIKAGDDVMVWLDGAGNVRARGLAAQADVARGLAAEAAVPAIGRTGDPVPLIKAGDDVMVWLDGAGNVRIKGDGQSAAPPVRTPVSAGLTLSRLRSRIAALRAGSGVTRLRVLLVGDSWVRLPPLRRAFRDVLTASFPLIGEGFLSANPSYDLISGATCAASGWEVLDGTAVDMPYGLTPDGQMIHASGTAATVTWSARCTRFTIYTRQHAGRWRYRVDGGAWVTVDEDDDGTLRRTTISGLGDAVHVIEIDTAGNGGVVAIAGYFAARDGVSGIELSRFGDGGVMAYRMRDYFGAQAAVLSDEPPDLVLTVLGTNDARSSVSTPAVYADYMAQLVAAARAVTPGASIIHIVPPQGDYEPITPLSDYATSLIAAGLQTEHVNLGDYYPETFTLGNELGLWADTVHPSNAGSRFIADLVNNLLMRI